MNTKITIFMLFVMSSFAQIVNGQDKVEDEGIIVDVEVRTDTVVVKYTPVLNLGDCIKSLVVQGREIEMERLEEVKSFSFIAPDSTLQKLTRSIHTLKHNIVGVDKVKRLVTTLKFSNSAVSYTELPDVYIVVE